jgi:hypothetical protein
MCGRMLTNADKCCRMLTGVVEAGAAALGTLVASGLLRPYVLEAKGLLHRSLRPHTLVPERLIPTSILRPRTLVA